MGKSAGWEKLPLLVFLLVETAPVSSAPAPAALLPTWVPAPALVARLASPTILGRFQVRLPEGDKERPLGEGANIAYLCNGSGKNSPMLMFGMNTLPLKDRERVLKEMKDGTPLHLHTRGYTGITASATELGTIHGIPFKRLHWSGSGTVEGRTQGFLYFGLSGSTLFQIQADSPDKIALALAEASVLTLQPR